MILSNNNFIDTCIALFTQELIALAGRWETNQNTYNSIYLRDYFLIIDIGLDSLGVNSAGGDCS